MILVNMYISPYNEGSINNHDETRSRKLLLHKKEIMKLKEKVERENYTLVPLKLYFKKIELKYYWVWQKVKRNMIKEKQLKREIRKWK